MRKLKYRTADGDYRMFSIHEIAPGDFNAWLAEPLRCPKCGYHAHSEDMVAGWRQYSLPLDFEDYDLWTILAKCGECGERYGYLCRIDPDS